MDAQSGKRCPEFGADSGTPGEAQFDAGTNLDFADEVQIHSPPAIAGHVAVFGSTLADMMRTEAPSGMIRALDARSGKLLWTFDPVPRDENDPAASSWGMGSNEWVGAGNAWSFLSADPANNLIFVPTTSPSADLVGNYRPGDNRYTNSLVALDALTGEVRWHYQIVHHDLWDYDLPAQPILTELIHNGNAVPAVIQLTKQGMVFAFNRITGEPLIAVEERAVPQHSDDPAAALSAIQPFSVISLVQQGLEPEDAWGFTFWDRNACKEKIESLRSEGIYTPPSEQGTVVMPASAGGMNWGRGRGGSRFRHSHRTHVTHGTGTQARTTGNRFPGNPGTLFLFPHGGHRLCGRDILPDLPSGRALYCPALGALDRSRSDQWRSALAGTTGINRDAVETGHGHTRAAGNGNPHGRRSHYHQRGTHFYCSNCR